MGGCELCKVFCVTSICHPCPRSGESIGPQANVGLKFSSIDTAVVISLRFCHQCLCISLVCRLPTPPPSSFKAAHLDRSSRNKVLPSSVSFPRGASASSHNLQDDGGLGRRSRNSPEQSRGRRRSSTGAWQEYQTSC